MNGALGTGSGNAHRWGISTGRGRVRTPGTVTGSSSMSGGLRGVGSMRMRTGRSSSSSKLKGSSGGAAGGLGRRGRIGSRSSPVRCPPEASGVSSSNRKPNAPPPNALSAGHRDSPGTGAYGEGRGTTRTSGSSCGTGGAKLSSVDSSSFGEDGEDCGEGADGESPGAGTGAGGGAVVGDHGATVGGTVNGSGRAGGCAGTGHEGMPGYPPGTTIGGSR